MFKESSNDSKKIRSDEETLLDDGNKDMRPQILSLRDMGNIRNKPSFSKPNLMSGLNIEVDNMCPQYPLLSKGEEGLMSRLDF